MAQLIQLYHPYTIHCYYVHTSDSVLSRPASKYPPRHAETASHLHLLAPIGKMPSENTKKNEKKTRSTRNTINPRKKHEKKIHKKITETQINAQNTRQQSTKQPKITKTITKKKHKNTNSLDANIHQREQICLLSLSPLELQHFLGGTNYLKLVWHNFFAVVKGLMACISGGHML